MDGVRVYKSVVALIASSITGLPAKTPPRTETPGPKFADFAGQPYRQPACPPKEERMDPVTVAASVVLLFVLAIFTIISVLGLMGPDSRRW